MKQFRQPELTDEWGCTFYGRAETITGDVWWYTDSDGVRRALMPKEAKTVRAGQLWDKSEE